MKFSYLLLPAVFLAGCASQPTGLNNPNNPVQWEETLDTTNKIIQLDGVIDWNLFTNQSGIHPTFYKKSLHDHPQLATKLWTTKICNIKGIKPLINDHGFTMNINIKDPQTDQIFIHEKIWWCG